jgi:hypothetical protein
MLDGVNGNCFGCTRMGMGIEGKDGAWDNHYGLLWGLMGDRITLKKWSGSRGEGKKIALLLLALTWGRQKKAPS